jgi:hypothetical protein
MTIGTIGHDTRFTDEDIATMHNELNAGRWVIGNVFAKNSSLGHSIVIQSYDADNDEYTYWDPWTNLTDVFTGYQLQYQKIRVADTTANRRLAWVQYCR